MTKQIIILCVLIAASCTTTFAQNWNKEDSLWLKRVLDGKEDVKINEETLKAIRDGRLIVPSWMTKPEENSKYEIQKNVENAGARDTMQFNNINPYSMPPAVFALYVLYIDKMDSINAERTILLSGSDRDKLMKMLPPGERTISAYSSQVFSGISGLDFNNALSMIFSASYRQRMHNRKYATAYKNYYDENGYNSIKITERERRQLRNAVNFNLGKQQKMPGSKTNPIDN